MEAAFFRQLHAHQLKQDGACLKKATFENLLSHRFEEIILLVITSNNN